MKIALLGRDSGGDYVRKSASLVENLRSRGVSLAIGPSLAEIFIAAGISRPGDVFFSYEKGVPKGTDIILTLGGDGTFISSLPYARETGIPVAGINFGRLGFLTAAEDLEDSALTDALLCGDYSVNDRSLLKVDSFSRELPDDFYPYALNEITFRSASRNLVAVDVKVGGKEIPTYWGDGIVIATPTGSTAYSLSLGGPIVLPGSAVALITPIASHNLNVRPLIIPLDEKIEVRITSSRGDVMITADDHSAVFSSGFSAVVASGGALRNISFKKDNFIDALATKLHWGEDLRNNNK